MRAIILAGGLGERLRPLTDKMPKPLLPIKGRPLLEHLLMFLKKYDIKEVTVSVGYKAEMIMDYFGNGEKLGMHIDYVVEKERLGTGGCLNLLKERPTGTFIVMNGDNLTNFDLSDMISYHKRKGKKATLALLEVEDPSAYGVAKIKDNLIEEFIEKPKKEDAPSNLISSGFYLFEPEVLSLAKGKTHFMLEKEVFPILAKEKELAYYKINTQWFDVGTLERYEQAIKEWKGI